MFIGLNDPYHNIASSTNVTHKCWTLTPSGNACVSFQSLVLSRCASAGICGRALAIWFVHLWTIWAKRLGVNQDLETCNCLLWLDWILVGLWSVLQSQSV